jgi:hypothetical protein
VLFLNVSAYHTNAPFLSSIRIAKLARWANCEVYFICNPSVPEFVDAVRHFSTQTLKFVLFYYAGNVISQDKIDASSALSVSGGTVGPSLVYQTIDQKQTNLRLVWAMDGVHNPKAWDPADHDLDQPGVLFIAPYADPQQAHLQQVDLKNESIFVQEMYTALRGNSLLTAQQVVTKIEPELIKFGQRVFCNAVPEEFKTMLAMIQ